MSLAVAIRHRFPGASIDVAFEAASPGITVLFGPSGAGKSTVIAAVSGLLRPDMCRVVMDGNVLTDTEAGIWLPVERRRMGLVFQDSRLFPHMSVARNLRFGLRRAGPGAIGFDDVIELLGIGDLLQRRPHTLSGGQRQRVAIGRALLAQPRLLLLDEPLASLDANRKAEILPFLSRLKTALRLPVLYVTHALDEVTRLADSLVLLQGGRVLAQGPVSAMLSRADLPMAQRDDAGALLTCRVAAHDPARGLTTLDAGERVLLVPLLDVEIGRRCRVRIPAREVILAARPPEAISLHNVIAGTVRQLAGDDALRSVLVEVGLPQAALLSRVTADAVQQLALVPGAPVLALIKSTSIEIVSY